MWADKASRERQRALVSELRSVLSSAGTGIQGAGLGWINGPAGPCVLQNALATISYSDGIATVSGSCASVKLECGGFDILEAALEAWQDRSGAFLAGFLSYDLAAELEDLGTPPPRDFQFPALYFGLYKSGDAPLAAEPPSAAANRRGLVSRPDRKSFEASVERIVATIHAGDIFQTNLCRSIKTDVAPGEEWDLFQRMRSISPACYEAFLRISETQSILSISPEMFLKVRDGIVESSPIKGTRPRGHARDEDCALAAELLSSEKDRAELAMIVDVVRNDLARVCAPGSVAVAKHAEMMSLPTVHHLFSTVRGELREDAGIADLLRASFPAASITGAPKIEAMRIARREEQQLRGPAMGAIGWISMDGNMEMSVAIRTAFVTGGKVRYYAGCGITADSVPRAEFEESHHKAAAFARALGSEEDPNW